MEKLRDLAEWQLNKNLPDSKRHADIRILFKYPDPKQWMRLEPKERLKKIYQDQKNCLNELLAMKLFPEYEIIGTKKRPRGVKVQVKFNDLAVLEQLDFIDSIGIELVEQAEKIDVDEAVVDKYYCVKMTVGIEIEGRTPKKQSIETRFVLIKANSFEDAYKRLERQKDEYAKPYLNSDGRFVRWRIDSFDDCYVTYSPVDLDKPKGNEIYSELGSRKSKQKVAWDGKW